MSCHRLRIIIVLAFTWIGDAIAEVVINEIHYDADPKTEAVEFVELHNSGDAIIDLSSWRFSSGIQFTFPANTVLRPSAYLVVAEDPAELRRKFKLDASVVLGPYFKRLSNGETLTLRDAADQRVDRVDYRSGFPWPTAASGGGSSMELIHPSLDNDLGGSWRSSGIQVVTGEPVSFITAGRSGWRYREGTSEASSPRSAWRKLDFSEDKSWKNGRAPIGYGDGDDRTTISMQNNFSSVYMRRVFDVKAGEIPARLVLRVYVDDGAVVWINGKEVARVSVPGGALRYNSFASNHEATWEEVQIPSPGELLKEGKNIIAIHALNATLSSSDFSIDAELRTPDPSEISGNPTPAAANSVFALNAPPQARQVKHEPRQPKANDPVLVSAKVSDSDGVNSVTLLYQAVEPGNYIRKADSAFDQDWTALPMADDAVGDSFYSATIPRSVQTHRTLIRYRIRVEDKLGNAVALPYADDGQPNFAYFCYNGVPGWTGSNRINGKKETFPPGVMASLPTYHLIANATDVANSQYNGSFDTLHFNGTLVYDGTVYDHIEFRNRGEFSTYVSGKNKWRLYFNRTRGLEARDNYGRKYAQPKKTINLNGCASPWMPVNRGMAGMEEAIGFKLQNLAGGLAPNTHFVHFRVIDDIAEAPTGRRNAQYEGDLWGLYLYVEHTDSRFLDERGLPDGNVYKIEGGNGDKRNQGPTQSVSASDWNSFRSGYGRSQSLQWWRDNLHLSTYYTFRCVNRIISNVDIREGWNKVFYHHPDGHWYPVPWDLDMLIIPETHWQGAINIERCLSHHKALNVEFKNRARELLDLLLDDASPTGGQIGQFIDEHARFINPPGEPLTFVDVDQFMWNYHPRTAGSHRGQFYVSPKSQNNRGGTWTRRLKTKDFEGMMLHMLGFMTDTDPGRWSIGDGDPRGYGYNYLEHEAKFTDIPDTPVISYAGPERFPLDALQFESSPFKPGRSTNNKTFTGIQWRLAEVSNPETPHFEPGQPWKYEVNSVWELQDGELVRTVAVPQSVIRQGGTYRARVRMRNGTMAWSHWSAPVEFLAGEPNLNDLRQNLVFSEIMYNPLAQAGVSGGEFEFLELKNIGDSSLDLGGLFFSSGIEFVFPEGSTIGGGETVLLGRNQAALRSRYPGLTVDGIYQGQLANEGETVTLSAGIGAPVFSVTYDDAAPWPEQADGQGYSLNVDTAGELGFRASSVSGGTPGQDDPGLAKPMDDLVLTLTRLPNGMLRVGFNAEVGRSYSLEATQALGKMWESLSHFHPKANEWVSRIISPRVSRASFFRLVTPARP
ncbi:MAG: lamin tail domain-containing protein [Verrucomicrobiota bacterium]|nr:lamin tail domain-containing protein [Verrucomicrobiota bacterium]